MVHWIRDEQPSSCQFNSDSWSASLTSRLLLKIIETSLTCSAPAVLGGSTCHAASGREFHSSIYLFQALQRVVRTAQYISGAKLPTIQELYTRRCQRKAIKIVKDISNPSHRLFSLLSHGKRYRSAQSRSKRLLNSFYQQAIIKWLPRLFVLPPPLLMLLLHSVYYLCIVTLITLPSCIYYLN